MGGGGSMVGAWGTQDDDVIILTAEQAQAIMKAGDLQMHEERTRRVKGRTDEMEVTDRTLVLTLKDERPHGDELGTFLAGIGVDKDVLRSLDGMYLGTKGESTVPRICCSYGSSTPGTMEVSMPLAPLEKVAGMTWEQANPFFAALAKPMKVAERE
jgi:hypothetical protein